MIRELHNKKPDVIRSILSGCRLNAKGLPMLSGGRITPEDTDIYLPKEIQERVASARKKEKERFNPQQHPIPSHTQQQSDIANIEDDFTRWEHEEIFGID